MARPARILFVCLGNICRSPTAEGTLRRLASEAGLDGKLEVESAGTGSWHVGEPPDERAVAAAAARGIEIGGRARQVDAADFQAFDLLIAMDRANRRELLALAPDEVARRRVRLLREFGDGRQLDVPDPYFGGDDGFAEVLEIVERSCAALLDELRPGLEP